MALRTLLSRKSVGVFQTVRRCSTNITEKSIILQTDGETGISTVILNRPPVNSLGLKFMQDIIMTIDTLVNHFLKSQHIFLFL